MGFFDKRKRKLINLQTESYNPRKSWEERHNFSSYDEEEHAINSVDRDAYDRSAYSRDNLSDVYGGRPYPEDKPYDCGQRGYDVQHGYESQRDVDYDIQRGYGQQRDIGYGGRYGYAYENQKDVFGQRVNNPAGNHTNRRFENAEENRLEQHFSDECYYRGEEAMVQVECNARTVPQIDQYPKKGRLVSRRYEKDGVIYYTQDSDTLDKGKDRKEEKSDKKSFFPIFKSDSPEQRTRYRVEPPEHLPPPRRTVNSKLTIFLVENTAKVFENQEIVLGIVKKLLSTGFVCIINYGSTTRESEIYDSSSFDKVRVVCKEDQGYNTCFYDALVSLKTIFDKKFLATEKREFEDFILSKVDIVGIGTGRDNCSKAFKEEAIKCFCDVIKSSSVTSKYFCMTEDSFMDVAEIGFRSIGAISKEY